MFVEKDKHCSREVPNQLHSEICSFSVWIFVKKYLLTRSINYVHKIISIVFIQGFFLKVAIGIWTHNLGSQCRCLDINNLMLYIFNLWRLSHQEKHDIMKKIIWGPSKVAKIKYSWKLSPIFDQNHITYWNPFCFDFQFFKSHWKHCNIGDTNLSLSKTQSGGFVPWSFVDRLFDLKVACE